MTNSEIKKRLSQTAEEINRLDEDIYKLGLTMQDKGLLDGELSDQYNEVILLLSQVAGLTAWLQFRIP